MHANLKRRETIEIDARVLERKTEPGVWSVEIIDYQNEGSIYLTNFYGPDSEKRAKDYVRWQQAQ